jgi:hypothetical protein
MAEGTAAKRSKEETGPSATTMEEVVAEIDVLSQTLGELRGTPNMFPLDRLGRDLVQKLISVVERMGTTPARFHHICESTRYFKELCHRSRLWDAMFLLKFVIKQQVPLSSIRFSDYQGNPLFREWLGENHRMPNQFVRLTAWMATDTLRPGTTPDLEWRRLSFLRDEPDPDGVYRASGFEVAYMERGDEPQVRCRALSYLTSKEFGRRYDAREAELTSQWKDENPNEEEEEEEEDESDAAEYAREREQQMADWVDGGLREEFHNESGMPKDMVKPKGFAELTQHQQGFLREYDYDLSLTNQGYLRTMNPRTALYEKLLVYQLLQSYFRPQEHLDMMYDPNVFAQCLICSNLSEMRCKGCKQLICGKQCHTQHLGSSVCGRGKQ